MKIQRYIKERQLRVERVIKQQFKPGNGSTSTSQPLYQAMSYAALSGGKRIRPILAYASAEAISTDHCCADVAACAVELIHTYSLIHDDLPAMDDDALRRGNPTCHIKFDEATAILAGDALQAMAFELLAVSNNLSVGNAVRLQMITVLSKASGRQGMVAGQSIDINATGTSMNEVQLAHMHQLKTGALITASVILGALSTGIVQAGQLARLEEYANCIGLAFQVVDDILDVESDTETLGKQQGQDQLLNKPTYTSMLGVQGAREKAQLLYDQGIAALDGLGTNTEALAAIARYIIQRRY